MLGLYLITNYIKTFLLVLLVLFGIFYLYLLGELFFLFKDKNLSIFLSYTINFLPIAFFYMSAFTAGLALILVFRRLINKKLDLLFQSFGLSPLRLSSYILLFSLFLSLVNLFGSYDLYAKSQKRLYRIEREYKRAKGSESGVVRNLWLKEETGEETRFYSFELVDVSTGRFHGFFLLKVREGSIRELITAEGGKWRENRIEVRGAGIKNLITGETEIKDLEFPYLELGQIKPLAEKPEHLSMKDALMLGLLGEKMGVNNRYYLYEIVRRVFTSTLPFYLSLTLSWLYLRWRRFNLTVLALPSLFFLHWLLLNLMKSLVENTNLELYLIFLLYLPIPLIALKGLYDLAKGFRV
ncbi:MAG: LptF/LptG family permease [Aquificaceae bacterium]|nr:LptF/LptG family permease [Aquificaceae bacterium]